MLLIKAGLDAISNLGILSYREVGTDPSILQLVVSSQDKELRVTYDPTKSLLSIASAGDVLLARKISENGAFRAIASQINNQETVFQDAKAFPASGLASSKNVFLSPLYCSDRGVVYQIGNKRFIHEGVDQKVSLLAYREFHDQGRTQEFPLVARLVEATETPVRIINSVLTYETAYEYVQSNYRLSPQPVDSDMVFGQFGGKQGQYLTNGERFFFTTDVEMATKVKGAAWSLIQSGSVDRLNLTSSIVRDDVDSVAVEVIKSSAGQETLAILSHRNGGISAIKASKAVEAYKDGLVLTGDEANKFLINSRGLFTPTIIDQVSRIPSGVFYDIKVMKVEDRITCSVFDGTDLAIADQEKVFQALALPADMKSFNRIRYVDFGRSRVSQSWVKEIAKGTAVGRRPVNSEITTWPATESRDKEARVRDAISRNLLTQCEIVISRTDGSQLSGMQGILRGMGKNPSGLPELAKQIAFWVYQAKGLEVYGIKDSLEKFGLPLTEEGLEEGIEQALETLKGRSLYSGIEKAQGGFENVGKNPPKHPHKFATKKEAREQQKAMFANGYGGGEAVSQTLRKYAIDGPVTLEYLDGSRLVKKDFDSQRKATGYAEKNGFTSYEIVKREAGSDVFDQKGVVKSGLYLTSSFDPSSYGVEESEVAFDVAEALYAYLSGYYSGQFSPEYKALCALENYPIHFHPGVGGVPDFEGGGDFNGNETAKMIYDDILAEGWEPAFEWLKSYCSTDEDDEDGGDYFDPGDNEENNWPDNGEPQMDNINNGRRIRSAGLRDLAALRGLEDEEDALLEDIESDEPDIFGGNSSPPATNAPGRKALGPLREALEDLGIPDTAIDEKKNSLDVDLSEVPEVEEDVEGFLRNLQKRGAKGIHLIDRNTISVYLKSQVGRGYGVGRTETHPKEALVEEQFPRIKNYLDRSRVPGRPRAKADVVKDLTMRFPKLDTDGAELAYMKYFVTHQAHTDIPGECPECGSDAIGRLNRRSGQMYCYDCDHTFSKDMVGSAKGHDNHDPLREPDLMTTPDPERGGFWADDEEDELDKEFIDDEDGGEFRDIADDDLPEFSSR